MANKKSLLNGVSVKVEHRSGFDKSRFHALTTGVGTITPIAKQLMIPGSFNLRINLNAKLPPLAADAYLRTHLKVEAFFVPMRLCYGGFESWFCGKEMYDTSTGSFVRAKLPRFALVPGAIYPFDDADGAPLGPKWCGPSSLLRYLGVRYNSTNTTRAAFEQGNWFDPNAEFNVGVDTYEADYLNIFPMVSYWLIIDEWYRNKLVQKPLFAPHDTFQSGRDAFKVAHLPYSSFKDIRTVLSNYDDFRASVPAPVQTDLSGFLSDSLLDGSHLLDLRQRNYGDDYFTVASPNAQEGNPVQVSTAGGAFTISALRMQNALQEFAELNQYASPDFVQTMSARYGSAPSSGVAQKPVLLGSADFPMFTKGVETSSPVSGGNTYRNPFIDASLVGATAGKAYANGQDFVCSGKVDEPGYLMVLASLVPEANYATGVDHDMRLFTEEGSIVDLPVGALEHVGNEPIFRDEVDASQAHLPFGYVQRYLWHKAGQTNQISGLFALGESLQAFIPQRSFNEAESGVAIGISSDFLRIEKDDLDGVAAVNAGISAFGVQIDSNIELFVSEPLSESALPALSNPAIEHGRNVYLKAGATKLN